MHTPALVRESLNDTVLFVKTVSPLYLLALLFEAAAVASAIIGLIIGLPFHLGALPIAVITALFGPCAALPGLLMLGYPISLLLYKTGRQHFVWWFGCGGAAALVTYFCEQVYWDVWKATSMASVFVVAGCLTGIFMWPMLKKIGTANNVPT